MLPAQGDGASHIRPAAENGNSAAGNGAQDRGDAGVLGFADDFNQMAAGDVADFVREHPDHLKRAFALH